MLFLTWEEPKHGQPPNIDCISFKTEREHKHNLKNMTKKSAYIFLLAEVLVMTHENHFCINYTPAGG